MAKFRYQHIYSAVEDKAPDADFILDGEIAVNGFAGKEKLFIKNSEGDVVAIGGGGVSEKQYNEDQVVIAAALNDLDNRKIGKGDLNEMEAIIAAALNDLDNRKIGKGDLNEMEAIIAAALNDLDNRKIGKKELDEEEAIISASLNDLNKRFDGLTLKKISQSDYDDLVNAGTVDANTLYIII